MNQILANRYQVIKQLGSGGFGETFLAQDNHSPTHKTCVIKQLKPINNEPQIYQLVQERFKREAIILEELGNNSNQIPSLYAYFEENGLFYLVQEYIEGETLADLVCRHGCLSEVTVKQILIEVLEILEFIETKGIIHRDIKPDNIMIRKGDSKPVLIDFGAVRETMGTQMTPSGHSTTSIIIGTPGFMPPEQGIGRAVFSSDLYALGFTIIYLLTGKQPQEFNTNPMTGELNWREFVANINSNLASVLDQVINTNIQQRFINAQQMKQALTITTMPTIPITPIPPTIPVYPVHPTPPPNQQGIFSKIILGILGLTIAGVGISFAVNQFSDKISNKVNQEQSTKSEVTETPTPKPTVTVTATPTPTVTVTATPTPTVTVTATPVTPPTQQSYLWRSESGLTRINNLDSICWGNSILNSVQTVFGYNKSPFFGSIQMTSINNNGCQVGNSFSGYFDLSGNSGNCRGNITITWQNNNHAYLNWTITNLGSACPVGERNWSINTFPVPN